MLKYLITKAEYDALKPELQVVYSDETDDQYKLGVTGIDLKAQDKLEGERGRRRAADKKAADLQAEIDTMKEGDDRPALIAKHERDMAKLKGEKEKSDNTLLTVQKKSTLDRDAAALAKELSPAHTTLLMPHILSRLDVDLTDPLNPRTVVLVDGKASDKKLSELKAEFLANKEFSGIVVASSATGGAASRPGATNRSGMPSGAAPQNNAPADLSKPEARAGMIDRIRAGRQARGLEVPDRPAQ